MIQRRRILIIGSSVPLLGAVAVIWLAGRPPGDVEAAPVTNVPTRGSSSFMPVVDQVPFQTLRSRMSANKPALMSRALALLQARYDLADRPVPGATMSRGKPVQGGVRVKLPAGVTWQQLAAMAPAAIKQRGLWPQGFLPLPHPSHDEGGMVFPAFQIKEIKRQEGRDLARFDVDFDIPDHFLPEFPPPIFLTTRPDLGDVSQGKLVTTQNFYELFNGILNPKQLEGLRLLVSPVPAAAVQPDRRPPQRRAEHGRRVLRLPRQRPHQRGHAPGRRHPAAAVPAAHRHADACAASTSSGCSARSARCARSRTSPSSSSAPPTSTATP